MKVRYLFWLLLFSVRLLAQGVVYETDEYYSGNKLYCAGVKTDIFKFYAASQEYDCWCWAACVQMVLNYQGVSVEQKDLVKKAFGTVANRGGTGYDIVRAANGWYVKGKTISAQMGEKSQFDLIKDLAYHYPVIIGLNMPGQNMGHAYVLTAIFYYYDSYKRKVPVKVVLRDPWPYNESRTVLTWYDFYSRINCIVHVYP